MECPEYVQGIYCIAAFFLIWAAVGQSGYLTEPSNGRVEVISNGVKQMKSKMKMLFIMWILNLLTFTVILWAGYYFQSVGITWIKIPCEVTLASTGIAKLILTFMIVIGAFGKVEACE